ncbi:MAG: alpha/beta fold hydrolase [Rhizomicrobium sp.]
MSIILAVVATGCEPEAQGFYESGGNEIGLPRNEPTNDRLARKGATRMIIAGRKVDVWRPVAGDRPAPLILFSHGFSGCGAQSSFLMRALANAGYLVVAPNHKDARCADGNWTLFGDLPDPSFLSYRRWNADSYSGRRDDMWAVMEAVLTDPAFHADPDRIGLVGHSLGGYTVLGLAGAWPAWRTPGIKAVVALSPWCAPFVAAHTLNGVSVPTEYQGGTLDLGLTPTVKRKDGCYESTPAPAAFVEFSGAGHLAWTDLISRYQQQAIRYTLAWLDHYVRDAPAAAIPTAGARVRDQRVK